VNDEDCSSGRVREWSGGLGSKRRSRTAVWSTGDRAGRSEIEGRVGVVIFVVVDDDFRSVVRG